MLAGFNSAIALAQLERLDELVKYRIETAKLFIDTMSNCDYLIPQVTPKNYTNSYWALGVKYEGFQSIGLSWEEFRKEYISAGGDGFYGAWSVPYLEPVFENRNFEKVNHGIYKDIVYEKGLCPIAESIQQKLMVFKTNYRSFEYAEKKATALEKVINKFK